MIRTKKRTEQAKNQLNLLHPILDKEASKTDKGDYIEEVQVFAPARWCRYFDCKICYKEHEVLKRKEIVVLGKPRFCKDALDATERYHKDHEAYERSRRLELMRIAMLAMSMSNTTFDVLDKLDESNAADATAVDEENAHDADEVDDDDDDPTPTS